MEFEGLLLLGFLFCIAVFAVNFLLISLHWLCFFTVGLLTPVIFAWGAGILTGTSEEDWVLFTSYLHVYFGLLLIMLTVILLERLLFGNVHFLPWRVNSGSTKAIIVSEKINNLLLAVLRLLTKPFVHLFSPILKPLRNLLPTVGKNIEALAEYLEKYVPIMLSKLILSVLLLTYIMSIYRWFARTHTSFWEGFKELFWALIPYLNVTYVWDLWWGIITFLIRFWVSLF
jgi:hypothetical protein